MTTDTLNSHWTQSGHEWVRPLTHGEHLLCIQSEAEQGALDFTVSLVATLPLRTEEAVSQAWAQTRFRLPIMGVTLETEAPERSSPRWVYSPVKDGMLDTWLSETLSYRTCDNRNECAQLAKQTADQCLAEKFASPFGLHLTFITETGGDKSWLVLHARHAWYDVQGICVLASTFLTALAVEPTPAPTWGDEIDLLPIAAQQALEEDVGTTSPTQQEMGRMSMGALLTMANQAHYGLPLRPLKDWSTVSDDRSVHRLSLTQDQTTDVVNTAQKMGMSVTPLVVACAMRALQDLNERGEGHVMLSLLNARRWLPARYAGEKGWPFMASMGHVFLGTTDLVARGNRVEQALQTAHEVADNQAEMLNGPRPYPLWGAEEVIKRLEESSTPLDTARPPPEAHRIVCVSSLGVMDEGLQTVLPSIDGVALEEFSVDVRLTAGVSMLHCWTWHGQLTLQVTAPKWFDPKATEREVEETVQLLLDASNVVLKGQ